MQRPSKKAILLGEELCDYVTYGLTRNNVIEELAEMSDESNREILEAVRSVLQDAQRNGGFTNVHIAHLQRVFLDYEPFPRLSDSQGELAGMDAPTHPRLL